MCKNYTQGKSSFVKKGSYTCTCTCIMGCDQITWYRAGNNTDRAVN